jgi:hypothetical protein
MHGLIMAGHSAPVLLSINEFITEQIQESGMQESYQDINVDRLREYIRVLKSILGQ